MYRGYTKSWRKKYESRSASRGLLYLGAMDYLVGNANFRESWHDGEKCERGQLFVGRRKLAEVWQVSEQTVRTILSNLEKDGFLTSRPTNKGRVITILNYGIYQSDEESRQPEDQPPGNQRPANGQPPLKNGKNGKNEKDDAFTAGTAVQAEPKISYNWETHQFENIAAERLAKWHDAFPAVDIGHEIRKAEGWQWDHPKNRKSDYSRFLWNWFQRAQNAARPQPGPAGSRDILRENPEFKPGERGTEEPW